jgi:exosortase
MQYTEGFSPARGIAKPRLGDSFFSFLKSEAFVPALLITAGLTALFWGLFTFTFSKWSDSEGYYTHGFLVPFICGYIVYRWWPRLKHTPVKAGWAALPLLFGTLWIAYCANRTDIYAILSLTMILLMALSAWIIAGWRWMVALLPAIGYLLFALPVWDQVINAYTNPLQLMSTSIAFHLLQVMFLHPVMADTTLINIGNYHLEVAVACSGLKLLLALVAFGVFFLLIARLKVWKSILFAASIIPLALFMNGLRIALVGAVGNFFGFNAGHVFHDYSGYIVIVLSFFILDRYAKLLGFRRDAVEADEPVSLSRDTARSLKARAMFVGAALVLGGAVVWAAPKPKALPGRTEAWMEQTAPSTVGNYKIESTYKMDPSTYKELQPYGIVCRILGDGKQSYDVTLVASNRKTSFHDPRVCFPAQGWSFDDQKRVVVNTARGPIPVSIISMTEEDTNSNQLAAYFFRGPKGFYPTPQALSFSMLMDQFMGKNDEGVFYRFMPNFKGATLAQLETFIQQYMDEAQKKSGGFF